jgi:ASTRA-associated protein 1
VVRVRLYSVKTLKPLGTLHYHKGGCQAIGFAKTRFKELSGYAKEGDEAESDEELDEGDKRKRGQWLVSGGKDNRIAIWPLMSFTKP